MNISTKGLIEIMSHEGICLEPYQDSVGVWTVGVGETKSDDIDPRTMLFTNGGGANYFPGSIAGVGTNYGTSPCGLYN